MGNPVFIGAQVYRGSSYGARHPLSIQRVPAVTDLCRALGWLGPDSYRTSPRAKPEAMLGFHTAAYLDALQQAEAAQEVDEPTRKRHGLGTLSNPVFPEMYRRPATAVGGGLLAAELVVGGGLAYNPGGGTHHGLADRAAGFCYLNEPVLTIQRLLEMGLGPVAYVDIDAHHGDGVELAFDGARDVRVISVHEAGRWPFTGGFDDTAGGAALNLPVPRGFNDSEFALLLDEVIVPAVAALKPASIYLQCGADALAEDPLSRLGLSNNSHRSALRALRPLAPRLIVSGGGGYNPWSTARCWAGIWAEIAGFDIPDRLPDPARAVLAGLSWARTSKPSETLLTTLKDPDRHDPIRPEIRDLAKAAAERV
jgi:acetoin utilization protein AcuC